MVLLTSLFSCVWSYNSRANAYAVARTSAFRADSEDDSAPHRVLSVHTQRQVATDLCEGLLPWISTLLLRIAEYNSTSLERDGAFRCWTLVGLSPRCCMTAQP